MDGSAEVQRTLLQQVVKTEYPADLKRHVSSVPVATTPLVQQMLPPLSPGWMEMKDPEGRTLYVNPTTGQSSWQRPVLQALPNGWQKLRTPEGKEMYVHLESGAVSYEHPATQQPQTNSHGIPKSPTTEKITRVVVQRPKVVGSPPMPSSTSIQATARKGLPRSMTAPVIGNASLNVQVDVAGLTAQNLQRLPGVQQARIVHQLSENNNVQVLTKKLASDVAQTSITAASLATRQAKTVGKMLVSPKKLQKFSKRMVVQTGAMSVKAGRACKVVINEMVDTADGKGKYAQKKQHRPFVAFSASTTPNLPVAGGVNQQPLPQPLQPISTPMTTDLNPQMSVKINANTGVPARKPTRKPVASPTLVSQVNAPGSAQQVAFMPQNQMAPLQSFGENLDEKKASHLIQSSAIGGLHEQQILQHTGNPLTLADEQTKVDVTSITKPEDPISPLGPPSYQQAVHSKPTVQQNPQNHTDGTFVQTITTPGHVEHQINVDLHQVLNTVEKPLTSDHDKPGHSHHATTSHQQHGQHNTNSNLQDIQLMGQQVSSGQGQSNTTYQPEIVYLQSSPANQQVQLTTAVDQSDVYVQHAIAAQQVDPNQMASYQQGSTITFDPTSVTNSQLINSQQDMVSDQVTYVDTGDVTVTEEEIVYVDENGNIISEDMLTFVDESTGEVFAYEECEVNGEEYEADVGDSCDFDF